VALKVILGGRFSKDALERFHLERQALAIMDHPSIAKVFDAEATVDGQPYFVMEYVPGEPITDYCDSRRLTIPQRLDLDLFVKVCEAVRHAHQKAIMHRDLKPSNILVVETDGRPTPRIIDFGVAKSVSQESLEGPMLTGIGRMVGTPGYISPEQADPAVVNVDTRTDVYSLGVVLYELLSGYLPFDPKQWQGKNFWDAIRQLKEEDRLGPAPKSLPTHTARPPPPETGKPKRPTWSACCAAIWTGLPPRHSRKTANGGMGRRPSWRQTSDAFSLTNPT
jgi:serine/threonine protein kinase